VPQPPGQPVLQLRIALEDIHPRVWRRVLVPGSVHMDKLHRMFQAAMGWEDYHLHYFNVDGSRFGMHFDEYPDDEVDEKTVTVQSAIGDARGLSYEYDFGDSWTHEVVVEAKWRMPIGLKFAVCVDGQHACPPEDCGGVSGFRRLLEALADPNDDEHEEYLRWVGGAFDPFAFDLGAANAALQRIR
jgi:hypothetical protein